MAPEGGNIKVVVRVRPFNSRELDRKAACVVEMQDGQTVLTPPTGEHKPKDNKAVLQGSRTFAFDKSYWSFNHEDKHFASQETVFDDLGTPLLDNAFQGYNNCIFAYGQTGSGKSYSMMGFGPDSGVIPRICKNMFDRIEDLQKDKNLTCTVEVSYLEIYNERVRDLLNPATKGNLRVREHPSTGPYVEDLAKLLVRSFNEIESLMDEGNKARTVAATNMNETSSRSHAVFTLTLTQKRHDEETGMDMERAAKISLVDLAGSERATSTGATGARLKEGAEINRSLSTLGRVIAALADVSSGKKKNMSMIPYRDSVLTWLLKDSLGGNSLTAMIATISPADINFEETLSTLRYADSAKRIKQHAVVNEDANARIIRELKEELAQLRAKLAGGGAGDGTGQDTQYPDDTPLDKQMVYLSQPDGSSRLVSKADIAEQLSQSEKLYQDLNQTWEQKLQKTEEIHKEREAALEELGISIEKGFVGVSTPKKMPHLVNLSDDPLLAECLVYNLKPGNTTVGNDEMTATAEIRLKGSKILKEHCIFENSDGVVTVIPNDDAAVMVNGLRIDGPKRLRSGYRVILGDFHIFRFNHPQEARAERDEQGSRLKQSTIADDLDPPSPSDRLRTSVEIRKSDSDNANQTPPESPTLFGSSDHDYDWSFARREAANAILGVDQKISNLTDEELDVLFEDLQKVRANRRGKVDVLTAEKEYDSDSVHSYPVREKYLSAATLDSFSLDTAITAPSTPPQGEDAERVRMVHDDVQSQPENQGASLQESRFLAEESNENALEVEAQASAAQKLSNLREEMERQLREQKQEYERKLEQMRSSPVPPTSPQQLDEMPLTPRQKALTIWALEKWRQRKYVRMATHMLQYAATLKEAQILSQQMNQSTVFQFTIIDTGHTMASSYDMVLTGISDDDDDDLYTSPKPCLGIRVIDFKHDTIYLWSLEKLKKRLLKMRQMLQYLERPEYLRHFRIENPFTENYLPQFSKVGDVQVTLAAVFESRVQDFVADVFCPYTFTAIGVLKLSLEPSLADAPASTLKFNVILQELAGFSEMEGKSVHAQLIVSHISEDEGVTTSQLIEGFDEGPIRFDSLHGMSLPSSSPRDSYLRISLFARSTSMHLDRLLSWDDMRDATLPGSREKPASRIAESEYYIGERHDVFAQVKILELTESGAYEPVEVLQADTLDSGAFQLHQGLQRRIVVDLTHTCGDVLPWQDVMLLRASQVHLLDASGKIPELTSVQPEVILKLVQLPSMVDNADGTSNVQLTGQWDSSAHDSVLLNRITSEKHRIQFTLAWQVLSPRLTDPLKFNIDLAVQIRPRSFIRQQSMLSQFWATGRSTHSTTGIFAVDIKQNPVKSARDLWRLDTKYDYVRGEENLEGWAPRGVSLIRDYMEHKKRQTRAVEIEAAKSVFGKQKLVVDATNSSDSHQSAKLTDKQNQLLERMLRIWKSGPRDPGDLILSKSNIDPPKDGVAFAAQSSKTEKGSLSATVHFQPKNPVLLKSGYLFMPDASQTKWIRRFLELRLPFIHVYSIEGDELNAINLRDSRVDHQPGLAKLLQRDPSHAAFYVFAIYARENAFLFATRSERERVEWILRIDQSYFANSGARTPANDG